MMTFEESAALMNDPVFRGRVKAATVSYAGTLLAQPPANNSPLFGWARSTYQNPDLATQQVVPPAVMNVNVQQAGPDIDDAALLATVEYVVGGLL
jgi:hypothetical protein